VPNFVKDEQELQDIVQYMQSQVVFLKTRFIIRSASSNFPVIRWLNFSPMVCEWDITNDDKDFDVQAVDRIFLTVTKNMDKAL